MNNSNFIPPADAEFNTWQNTWYSGTYAHLEDWQINSMEFERLEPSQAVWLAKYAIVVNPATRTAPAVKDKTEARAGYEKEIRAFVREYQTNNRHITDGQRLAIGLPVHKTTHTPVPTPTTEPEFTVDTSKNARITLHVTDQGSKSKAKPFGVHGFEARWAILSAPPEKVTELVNSSFDTNSPLTLEFEENERGKTIYFSLRWENTRGEKGPRTNIVSAIIP